VHVTNAFLLMSALAAALFALAVLLLNKGVGTRE
jgi:hypothetical protein